MPSRWARLDLVVHVGPTTVTLIGPTGTPVTHARKRFGKRAMDYRHFLAGLAHKPQAVPQVLPELLRELGTPSRQVAGGARDLRARHRGAGAVPRTGHRNAPGPPDAYRPAMPSPDGAGDPQAIDIPRGCAADQGTWLTAVSA